MLFISNKREFIKVKNNLILSLKDWNKQFERDKWSVSDNEPARYPCYCQIATTINYQHRFHFFYDGDS